MSLKELVDRNIKAARAAQFASSDQLSLGQIIDECKAIEAGNGNSGLTVCFDFEYARPTGFDSWRGVYAELASTFEIGGGKSLLSDFLIDAENAVGKTFEGYKGGDFTMTRETPVWVANYGNAGGTAVTGVYDDGWQVVLMTGYRPN